MSVTHNTQKKNYKLDVYITSPIYKKIINIYRILITDSMLLKQNKQMHIKSQSYQNIHKKSSFFCIETKIITSVHHDEGFLARRPGHEVIKLFPCSTQLSMKSILLINVKMPTIVINMPTIVGILTFISMINTTSEKLKARNFFICR